MLIRPKRPINQTPAQSRCYEEATYSFATYAPVVLPEGVMVDVDHLQYQEFIVLSEFLLGLLLDVELLIKSTSLFFITLPNNQFPRKCTMHSLDKERADRLNADGKYENRSREDRKQMLAHEYERKVLSCLSFARTCFVLASCVFKLCSCPHSVPVFLYFVRVCPPSLCAFILRSCVLHFYGVFILCYQPSFVCVFLYLVGVYLPSLRF